MNESPGRDGNGVRAQRSWQSRGEVAVAVGSGNRANEAAESVREVTENNLKGTPRRNCRGVRFMALGAPR
jgi:hypothetical protein